MSSTSTSAPSACATRTALTPTIPPPITVPVGQRVLDLHPEVRRPGLLARDEPRAAARELFVVEAAALAGAALHPHLVARAAQRRDPVRHHPDAVFDHLLLARHPDSHRLLPTDPTNRDTRRSGCPRSPDA